MALRPRLELCRVCESISARRLAQFPRQRLATFCTEKRRTRFFRGVPGYQHIGQFSRTLATKENASTESRKPTPPTEPRDLNSVAWSLDQATEALFIHDGIPSESDIAAVLQSCARAASLVAKATETESLGHSGVDTPLSRRERPPSRQSSATIEKRCCHAAEGYDGQDLRGGLRCHRQPKGLHHAEAVRAIRRHPGPSRQAGNSTTRASSVRL